MNDANLTLILISAALLGCGVYLLLERSLSRVLVGLVLMGNGVSIAFLVAGGPAGSPPIVGEGGGEPMADPLPQAMVLTAIVITLATVSFVLAMAYRSWQLNGHDDVQDDVEDATIRRLATADVTSEAYAAVTDSDGSDDPREEPGPDELGPPKEPDEPLDPDHAEHTDHADHPDDREEHP
ncbi:Na(+)/H(+) antiporter subunit C [Nocardioides lianchengensis]|uniref:Multicomponent Na+:H+ antiporter subunit C n=1 Tax=Nocardioides lianchengensis TaxID=1045774 RepID=A0A1G6YQK2_9ACTN|nr:Na(+)/H(+) antiporter subunit C [Nocardioides lianchengensis]NYG09573.1 multicomponent Na+:H+ antiporter subunit C [Nocardioides lianchengensis]SDD92313.1 multicomponent Na+:H+ antiporter subunit C [Nocardioides lianchengensis]